MGCKALLLACRGERASWPSVLACLACRKKIGHYIDSHNNKNDLQAWPLVTVCRLTHECVPAAARRPHKRKGTGMCACS